MKKIIAVLLIAVLLAITTAFTIYLPAVRTPGDISATGTFNAIATIVSTRQTATSASITMTAVSIGATATFNAIATMISSQQTATSAAKTLTAAPSKTPTSTPTITPTPVPTPVITDSAMTWIDSVTIEITGHVQNISVLQHMCSVRIYAAIFDVDGVQFGGEGIWDSGSVDFSPGVILSFSIKFYFVPSTIASYKVWVGSYGLC